MHLVNEYRKAIFKCFKKCKLTFRNVAFKIFKKYCHSNDCYILTDYSNKINSFK